VVVQKDHFHRIDAKYAEKIISANYLTICVIGVSAVNLLLSEMSAELSKLTIPGTMPELICRNPS
jgi:hypothetical protein